MSLKCCSKNVQILRTVNLFDTETKTQQVLTIGRCRNEACGCIVALLQWYNIKKQKFEYFKPKRKDTNKFIQECERNRYVDTLGNVKQGTKENMNWLYSYNGNIYDFNGTNWGKVNAL